MNLPHAASARDEIKQVVTLTLTREGELFLDDDEAGSTADAAMKLAGRKKAGEELAVVIKADRAVEHGRVIDVMDAARQVGVAKIFVAVQPFAR